MGSPLPGSPVYYWLEQVRELQSLLTPADVLYNEVYNLLCYKDMELLTVATLCAAEPGNPPALTDDDMTSGAWMAKMRQSALQSAYCKNCQD